MAEFDWRPLIYALTIAAFMLLWLVGCTLINDSGSNNQTSTSYPRVTLTVGRIEQTINPTDSPRPTQYNTTPVITDTSPTGSFSPPPITTFASRLNITATPVDLTVLPPLCYESASARTFCLGRVDNQLGWSVERVMLQVRLFQANHDSVDENAIIEQAVIPAHSSAPFRVDFDRAWDDYAGVAVTLLSADAVPDTPYDAATVERVQLQTRGALRIIDGIIRNDHATTIIIHRVVISLVDAHQRVYGYQVIRFDEQRALASGQTLPFSASILPVPNAPELFASVYVEARKR